jgi:hypothetical protein
VFVRELIRGPMAGKSPLCSYATEGDQCEHQYIFDDALTAEISKQVGQVPLRRFSGLRSWRSTFCLGSAVLLWGAKIVFREKDLPQ